MKRNYLRLIAVMIVLVFLISNIVIAEDPISSENISSDSYLDSVVDMILEDYNGVITREELYEAAIKGMFDSLDKYSIYYTLEDIENFTQTINGSYEGIGVSLGQTDEYVVILTVFDNSPAEKVGLIPYDKIVSADGIDLIGKTMEEAASIIRGVAGTYVELGIKRNEQEVFNVRIKRELVEISPVTYSTFGDTGYIRLDIFSTNSDIYFEEALNYMDGKGISNIIFDLRNNPGGGVAQAVSIARKLVPQGLITTLHFKSDNVSDVSYYSYLEKPKYKIAVLVNENSASASELLSSAIKESGIGKIIGTQTYGKGKVQNIFPILTPEAYEKYSNQVGEKVVSGSDLLYKHYIYPKDNEIIGWCKLTTGEYYTRDGNYIDGIGVTPDVTVADYDLINDVDIWGIKTFSKTRKFTVGNEGIDIFNLENFLTILGYDIGTPDTKYDQLTADQIKKFQADSKLYPYGVCDFATQDALNKLVIEKLYEIDSQFKAATLTFTN